MKVAAVVVAGTLLVALVLGAAPRSGGPPGLLAGGFADSLGAAGSVGSSAVTVPGRGAFKNLSVTVGQTRNLVNQAVTVTWKWTGADKHATKPSTSQFGADYLQLMQCWGDTSPDRTQCEFGALAGTEDSKYAAGAYAASRQIFPGSDPAVARTAEVFPDPAEKVTTTDTDYNYGGHSYAVPFQSVTNERLKGDDTFPSANTLFGPLNTNEIPFAATRPDGTGYQTFEVLTYREAAGLGCADIAKSGVNKGKPRPCWLVIVPRSTTEVDGTAYNSPQVNNQRLHSSPLSATNWANRIAVPLGFAPVGQLCPIGQRERSVGGVETASEAVFRWEPALCRNKGPVFFSSQLPESAVEQDLTGSEEGSATDLGLLNAPVSVAIPSDRILVYAPIAISGITIAVMIERRPRQDASSAVKQHAGERITDLKLTPRLAAKLMTQSYVKGIARGGQAHYLDANPQNIGADPDFLAINPEFKQLDEPDIDLLVPSGTSHTTALLWQWIAADQDARDFVAGLPDPWGMRVNPFYQGIDIPRPNILKYDPYCALGATDPITGVQRPSLCTLDYHPYAADLHQSARSTTRGDTMSRTTWKQDVQGYGADPLQATGLRSLLGVTDTPTAARYLLVTAKLRNASGNFVAPTTQTLLAGVATMRGTGVPGVTVGDPEVARKNAYPLTTITYAVAAPSKLTRDAAKDYALFVRYAAGSGQTPGTAPGTLPDGYAPLPSALRKRALAVANDIQARRGPANGSSGNESPDDSGGNSGTNGGSTGTTTTTPPATATPSGAAPSPTPTAVIKAIGQRTPADPHVGGRFAFLIALTLGISAAILGPLLPRLMRRLGQ